MKKPFRLTCVPILLAIAAPVGAQSADTLRYRESTDSEMWVLGQQAFATFHDALISVVHVTSDSAIAWYDEVEIGMETPEDESWPDLSEVFGDPFVLRFDEKGHVETLATPEFPESIEEISDLTYQFFDFFPARPPRALRVGLAWTDTLSLESSEDGGTGSTRRITRYEVVGDTAVDGFPVWVIQTSGNVSIKGEGPLDDGSGMRVRMEFDGPEDGLFWVSREDGRLVGRYRTSDLAGSMTMLDAPNAPTFDLTMTYVHEVDRVVGGDSATGE